MTISKLIAQLEVVFAANGDLEVVTGLTRTGYGQPITNAHVRDGKTFDENNENFDGPSMTVLDLVDDDNSLVGF